MRKIICFLLILLLAVQVSADAPYYVADDQNLLAAGERAALEKVFANIREEHGYDMVVVTVGSLGGRNMAKFSADYYEEQNYNADGVMLLVSASDGLWYIHTSGVCAEGISDDGAAQIGAAVQPYLEQGKYAEAFTAFADHSESFMQDRFAVLSQEREALRKTNNRWVALGGLGGGIVGVVLCALLKYKILVPKKEEVIQEM